MNISGTQSKSQSPSKTPPQGQIYEKKKDLFETNLVKSRSDYLNEKDSSVKHTGLVPGLNYRGCRLVQGSGNANVVSRVNDSTNNLNVADSKIVLEVPNADRFGSLTQGYGDRKGQDRCVNKFHQIRSKFEQSSVKLSAERARLEAKQIGYGSGSEKLREALRTGRSNLNVVREYKKDVPCSRLPIMYQDDVEALLSRKPNSVRNFVNSLNKQLNSYANKNADYKFKFGGYESKYPNLNRGCYKSPVKEERESKFELNLESLNQKWESLERNAMFGHFDEFRDFVNFEKYITRNHKLHMAGHKYLEGAVGRGGEEDRDNMLTYRSSTFGNYTSMSPVAEFAKSTSDLCNNSSRDGFYLNKSSNFYTNGSYQGSSLGQNNITLNFDKYFNNPNFGSGDQFKQTKLTSRTNVTRINTDEFKKENKLGVTKGEVYYPKKEYEKNILDMYYKNKEPEYAKTEGELKNQKKPGLSDIFFSKRFMQSFNTLPEGVNLVIDTPKSEVGEVGRSVGQGGKSDEHIFINTVNVVKAGWVWVKSSRTRNWVPKFMVLFYDDEVSPKNQYTELQPNYPGTAGKGMSLSFCPSNNTKEPKMPTDYNRYFIGDTKASNEGFWGIYQVYTQLNPNLNSVSAGNSKLNSPNNRSTSGLGNTRYTDSLIKDNSIVYLCILSQEPTDYYECITSRNYLQLYRVDTAIAPYLRSFNACWLTRLVTSRIRSNLEMIIISLVDDYECCFVPLCAAKLNHNISFSYEMELANRRKVNEEYNQWIFKLWEYSLRTHPLSPSCRDQASLLALLDRCGGGQAGRFEAGYVSPAGQFGANGGSQLTRFDSNSSTQVGPDHECGSINSLDKELSSEDTECGSPATESEGFLSRCYKFVCSLFWSQANPNSNSLTSSIKDKSKLRTRIIRSIKNCKANPESEAINSVGATIDTNSNVGGSIGGELGVENENLPSPQNFINWIDKYGFDDLSIKINMYTLVNRT